MSGSHRSRGSPSPSSDGVADVRLNRPEKLNALDPAMFDALVDAGERLAADPSVRAVVLSGRGSGVLRRAGLRLVPGHGRCRRARPGVTGRLGAPGARAASPTTASRPRSSGPSCRCRSSPPSTGWPSGGGLQIALAADLRIVAPDARLSVLEIRWGLIPDMTGTHMLRRLVPLDVAKELTWTGRMVSGDEAVALGLATRLSDDPRRMPWPWPPSWPPATRTPSGAPSGCSTSPAGQPGAAVPGRVARSWGRSSAAPTRSEAVTAFFEKRPPVFADPA